MQEIQFYKYQGTGNDFVMIDGISTPVELTLDQVRKLCSKGFGVATDGLIILKKAPGLDFEMDYYNADGTQSMCGNGGRCAVKFARQIGILPTRGYRFKAIDGLHEATIEENGWVNLKMKDVSQVKTYGTDFILNTGSPHYVVQTEDVKTLNVVEEGRKIRYSDAFKEEGINVNFVQTINDTSIFVRTYERGVENETLSCGTGVTAASIVAAHNDRGFNRIEVETLGGKLAVEFDRTSEEHFENVLLCGPAELVFEGRIKLP
jgi:diaminopimelate epimerase